MTALLVFRIYIPFAAGYYLSFGFRTINAVIAPDLVRDIGIDAAGLGLLTSVYLLTFAAFQIPLGVLLDRYGPKATQVLLLMFAALGAYLFARAGSVEGLIAGRALIGFGVSGCLMASLKAFAEWFPRRHLPLVNGVTFMVGGIGAMSSTAPVEAVLGVTDWRGVFLGMAAATVGAAVLIAAAVPGRTERPAGARESFAATLRGFGAVIAHPKFIRFAPLSVLCSGVLMGVLGLWSGPWLRDVGGLSREAAADGLFFAFLSMTLSYLASGWLAARLAARGIKPEHLSVIGMCLFLAVQLLMVLDFGIWPVALWVLFAAFGTFGSLIYAALAGVFPPELVGRVNTALNLLVFIVAFISQWGVGAIINLWPAAAEGGYAAEGYAAALVAVLAVQGIGLIWLIMMPLLWRRAEPL